MTITLNCLGQAPGYLGNRFFVEGDLGLNVGFYFPSTSNTTDENKYLLLRPTAKISANWVYARRKYVAAEIGYQQFSSTQDSLYNFAGQPSLKYRISNQFIGIGFYKTSRKKFNALAPIGFYSGFKFLLSKSSAVPVRYAESNDRFEGVEKAAYNLNFKKTEMTFLGLALSTGFRTVLKDKFTLNSALDFGYYLNLNNFDSRDPSVAFSYEELKRNNSLYLQFNIGFGVLLF